MYRNLSGGNFFYLFQPATKFTGDISNVAPTMISVFDCLENIVRKGENEGCKQFHLFLHVFRSDLFLEDS